MRLVKSESVYRKTEGDWYLAVIVAEEEPESGEITGKDVEGCNDDDLFAAGSVIITPSSNWVAFTDGKFSAKS